MNGSNVYRTFSPQRSVCKICKKYVLSKENIEYLVGLKLYIYIFINVITKLSNILLYYSIDSE